MKRLLRLILSRTSLILLLLLLQLSLVFVLVRYVSQYWYWNNILHVASVIIVFYLIAKEENPMYKLTWIIPILIFPLFGGFFYLFYRRRNFSKKVIHEHLNIDLNRYDYVHEFDSPLKSKDARYLESFNFPSYTHTETTFLGSGEALFEHLKRDLVQAKSYIFLEFFIINKGYMWDELLEILKKKAKEGIDIKIIYDDFGSSSLPYHYPKTLKKYGIEALQFNPMRMHLNFAMNYRDHRKIVVINGKIAYTGGSNIGDEYINKISPFGHWLDAGIKIEGRAVYSFVLTFLENYRFTKHKDIPYERYLVTYERPTDGYVIPFSDTPLDKELTTKNMYVSLIMQAETSIDITTPYLIIDHELSTVLKLASKSGVKVRIIIPYVPDKKIIYMVTESYVPDLLEAGIEVYHYTPGFIHSKMMIIDQKKAMIGTANLDFRSLYLHFENSLYLDGTSSIKSMHHFFEETIKSSHLIDEMKKPNILYRLGQTILKGFSSLL